jgi:hypothetical protein
MGTDAPCPLGPPLRVTVGTRARELGCVLPGPGKRRVVSIRLGRLGAPMASSAHRPGHPVPVRRDASLNNFDGDSVEHLSVPRVDALASLDGSGASWAPRRSSTRRRYRCTASRRSPLPQARHSTGRYLQVPRAVADGSATGDRCAGQPAVETTARGARPCYRRPQPVVDQVSPESWTWTSGPRCPKRWRNARAARPSHADDGGRAASLSVVANPRG